MTDYESILIRHKFKYKKALGQNFIFDEDLLGEIAEAGDPKGKTVVEIGAGCGSLSRQLAARCKYLNAFEIDETLFPILNETLKDYDNVHLLSNNVLDLGAEIVDTLIGCPFVVISNFPYYITTPLIFLFLECENCSSITCLVQKEVANRICARSGGDYGALSASVQAVGEPKLIRIVKAWDFYPQPDVDSALIRIDKTPGAVYSDRLDKYIKQCFTQKRKTLVNNLLTVTDKQKIVDGLQDLGFSENARAEQLGTENLIKLGKALELV